MTREGDGLWRRLTADPRHGPLPVLLLGLTVLTGIVDAVSILALGRVFVANMTGNVVFVGFALAGPGFSLSASLSALGGFVVGAGIGGALAGRIATHRGRLLQAGVAAEAALLGVALVVSAVVGTTIGPGARDVVAALAAIAMGIQNAVVRRLAVPDLTTTVLTMTLTGIAADVRASGWSKGVAIRALAVVTMFAGAVGGALLVLHASVVAALGVATGLVVLVALGVTIVARRPAPWQ